MEENWIVFLIGRQWDYISPPHSQLLGLSKHGSVGRLAKCQFAFDELYWRQFTLPFLQKELQKYQN